LPIQGKAAVKRLSDAPAAKHDPIHTVPLTLGWFEKMRRSEVPGDIEEAAAALLDKGDLIQARTIFRLLTESFEGYAEGYNYLGLIALREEKLDEAISYFKKTSELGRRHFPKRMAKSSYWNDHRTRPFLIGAKQKNCPFLIVV
jgi:tetratricopeptide (TPR) repeat protein